MLEKKVIKIKDHQKPWIITCLGILMALGPISIDLYLPVFPEMAHALKCMTADMSLTLASYFAGVTLGQLLYGPVSDRIGRKKPLFFGLGLYLITALGCLFSHMLWHVVFLRFMMGIGGCVSTVITFAIVRDLFEVHEISRVVSLLILVLGFSPLIAPSLGGVMAVTIGWKGVFISFCIFALSVMLLFLRFPESHHPDPTVSLHPQKIFEQYQALAWHPLFRAYAFSGALAFASLYIFVAASPIIFFQFFHIGPQLYGVLFTGLALGYVGSNQINVVLQKFFPALFIFSRALFFLAGITFLFLLLMVLHHVNLLIATLFLALIMMSLGLIFPNASALALAPFPNNAGAASALMGATQMFLGMLGSTAVSLLSHQSMIPIGIIFIVFSFGALALFLLCKVDPKVAQQE